MSKQSLERELEEVRLLLDDGRSTEVVRRMKALMRGARQDASLLAQARCMQSAALEMQGRYRESLESIRMYEPPAERARLDAEARGCLSVQLALAYNYTGDQPKAIALLNAALREATERGSGVQTGAVYVALARVYRSINEYTIARDHAEKALAHFRGTGAWRGLAEAKFAIALAEVYEGNYESALEHFEQALKLVGDHPSPYLLGKIYTNMAGVCRVLKRFNEGIGYLEKAISYYEGTEHKANAVDGYNNPGFHLILSGDWERAQQALERSLSLAAEIDERVESTMILDSLGELLMLRGDLAEAENYLLRAIELATKYRHKWYLGQALRTLGRCHLAMNEPERALADGTRALEYAEQMGDRQTLCDSRLLLAEVHLRLGRLSACEEQLQWVAGETAEASAGLAVAGEAQHLQGLLALAQNRFVPATQHFGRSLSIYEMLGDRYRSARALCDLGHAFAASQPARAGECLTRAAQTFRELGARLDIKRTAEALAAFDHGNAPVAYQSQFDNLTHLILSRLLDAVASRELLLRELAAVVYQETSAQQVLILERDEDGRERIVVAHGWTEGDSAELLEKLNRAQGAEARAQAAAQAQAEMLELRASNALPATLFVAPREAAKLSGGFDLEPLLRVVELGLDVSAFREKKRDGRDGPEQSTLASQSFMPGFIHSSPAMTRLVEEVHKIRSSDVTVLVTGESCTGKELVARAIHALSARRTKVFVPFNCTAVPKELSDAYLFGYRRGSFTGAVSDSPGVIRAAAGGTLFLDEIGDLPLDIQPKLLRFLQEGEI